MIPQLSRSLPQDGAAAGAAGNVSPGSFLVTTAFLTPFSFPIRDFSGLQPLSSSRSAASRVASPPDIVGSRAPPPPPPLLPPPAPAGPSSLLRRRRCRPLWPSCSIASACFLRCPSCQHAGTGHAGSTWGAHGGSAQLAPPTTASASCRSIGPRGPASPVPPRAAAPVCGTLTPPSWPPASATGPRQISPRPSPISIVVAFPWPLVRLIVPPSRAHQTSVALWQRERLFPDIRHTPRLS